MITTPPNKPYTDTWNVQMSWHQVIMLFVYFSGLGYIVGANVASALGGWQWALRVSYPSVDLSNYFKNWKMYMRADFLYIGRKVAGKM